MESFSTPRSLTLTHSLPHTLTLPLSRAHTSKKERRREEARALVGHTPKNELSFIFLNFIYKP